MLLGGEVRIRYEYFSGFAFGQEHPLFSVTTLSLH